MATPGDGSAPTPDPAPAPAPAAPMTPVGWLKEGVTAVIGLLIVGVTVYLAVQLFLSRGAAPQWVQPAVANVPPERFDAFQRGKDVLLLLLPLAGAIVGYYTGRVIADRTIDAANGAASQANASAQTAQRQKRQVQDRAVEMGRTALTALEARRGAAPASSVTRSAAPAAPSRPDDVDDAEQRLRRMLNEIHAM